MDKKIVEYEIVMNHDIQNFKNTIDKMIRQEYQPFGNLNFNINNNCFIQAMVKYAS